MDTVNRTNISRWQLKEAQKNLDEIINNDDMLYPIDHFCESEREEAAYKQALILAITHYEKKILKKAQEFYNVSRYIWTKP